MTWSQFSHFLFRSLSLGKSKFKNWEKISDCGQYNPTSRTPDFNILAKLSHIPVLVFVADIFRYYLFVTL